MDNNTPIINTPAATDDTLQSVLVDIKKELRANMNGIASAHSRQTADYRINWGIELPRLAGIADEFRPQADRKLAQALWKEGARECRILACMLMPADAMDEDMCDIWAEDIRTDELATMFSLYLMPRLPHASTTAFRWIADEHTIRQTCGYLTLCHLMRRHEMSDSAQEEFLDQAASSLNNRYAIKALQIYASLGEDNARKVKKILDCLG